MKAYSQNGRLADVLEHRPTGTPWSWRGAIWTGSESAKASWVEDGFYNVQPFSLDPRDIAEEVGAT